MLILAGGIGNIFVVLATPATKDAGRDGWLSVLIAYALATLVGMVLIRLGKRFPNKTFVQYLPIVIGKILGKIVGLFYILGWFVMTPIILREIMVLMQIFLPQSPHLVTGILMLVLPVYAMKKGFKVFARTAELYSMMLVVLIIALLGLCLTETDFNRLSPVLENGLMPVMKGLIIQFPYAIETILFMSLWLPCLSKINESKKITWIGMSISGILLTLVVAFNIAFVGDAIVMKETFPLLYMVRHVTISNFSTGFESLLMVLWIASSYLELLVFFYQPVVGLAQWLNLKDYKALIIPMAIIIIILALVPSNIVDVIKLDSIKNPWILLPLGILIPIVWIVAVVRKLDESKINV